MRCTVSPTSSPSLADGPCAGGRERCLFASVLMLGGLLGLMVSPAARMPIVQAWMVVGVPLLTFTIAAPTRLGLLSELGLFFRGLEASVLSLVLTLIGRVGDARAVLQRQRVRVENVYIRRDPQLGAIVSADPLRLHHARRLALFGAALAVFGGVGLPFVFPSTYTFGDGVEAPFVFLFDLVTVSLAARVVTERMMLRLLEAGHALGGGRPSVARIRVVPLLTLLGSAMGAVGGLLVLDAASMASGIETSVLFGADAVTAARWFMGETLPLALPLAVGIGAVLGAGAGLAQPPERD